MTQHCTFCQIPLQGNLKARLIFYPCPECKTTFVHHYTNGFRGYKMEFDQYMLLFLPLHKQLIIRFDGEDILRLDHCPDIHPSKARHWLTKLLKLKAFA